MVATVELQISATKFAGALLSTLRQSPRCPPPAVSGLQLQRVRYREAAVRHDKTASFLIWQKLGPWGQGLGWTWISAKQAQLAVDVTLDVALTSTIAANPNTLVAAETTIDATIVLNLDCQSALRPGWLDITANLAAVENVALESLPGGAAAEQWARDQLAAVLSIPPLRYDLSASVPSGAHFQNAGVTIDQSGSRLVVRAELPMGGSGDIRWQNFLNGFVPDRARRQ
jgi:hypothetical protein